MAGATRLELATSGVTGRRSNQLSYAPAMLCEIASPFRDTEIGRSEMVGGTGLEPVALGL